MHYLMSSVRMRIHRLVPRCEESSSILSSAVHPDQEQMGMWKWTELTAGLSASRPCIQFIRVDYESFAGCCDCIARAILCLSSSARVLLLCELATVVYFFDIDLVPNITSS